MNIKNAAAATAALFLAACAQSGMGVVDQGQTTQSAHSNGVSAFYNVTELGGLGGTSASANSINQRDWFEGAANLSGNAASHAVLWRSNTTKDLGTLGGVSSAIAWPNLDNAGMIAGISEKPETNPYNEPWSCWVFFPYSAPSYHECVGFRWQNNLMQPLPTLGGPDGYAAGTNDWGEIVGWAENTTKDSTCDNGQVLQFEPVYWDRIGHVHQLSPLSGDPDGAATAVNDLGEIVGISGTCDQAIGRFTAAHVVAWTGGHVRELFTVSSVSWNTPQAINARGDVAGFINMPGSGDQQGNLQPVAFVFTHKGGLTQIAPLSGDAYSEAAGINDEGDVVGLSIGAGFSSARAFLYHGGKTYDLNGLTAPGSPYLLVANGIDDRGNIVGQALDSSTGDAPAYVAHAPFGGDGFATLVLQPKQTIAPPRLPDAVRRALLVRMGVR